MASEPYVSALAVSGSTLYAGGYFTTAGGTNANDIAQWNGSSWSALGSGMNAMWMRWRCRAARCMRAAFSRRRADPSFAAALDQREFQPAHLRGGRLLHHYGHQRSSRRRILPRIPILTPDSQWTTKLNRNGNIPIEQTKEVLV
jgi:hypothetical protein